MRAAAVNDNGAETPIAGLAWPSAFGPLGVEIVHAAAGGDRPFARHEHLPGASVRLGYRTEAEAHGQRFGVAFLAGGCRP